MIGKPATKEAYQLLHEGSLALAKVESVGMRVDEKYLKGAIQSNKDEIAELTDKLKSDKIFKTWKRLHKDKTKITARQQLVETLAKEGILKEVTVTAKGNIKADESVLGKIDHPFVETYLKRAKMVKSGEFLNSLAREVVKGKIHPIFDLHIPITYRPSSSAPNLFNIPKRDEEQAKIVRQVFIPRKNHVFVELDFKAVEVVVAACYNKDPVLLNYVTDPSTDMHKDTAAEIFMCPKKLVSKNMRFHAKNQFVFAEFYGSVYQQCAPKLWEVIHRLDLEMEDGAKVSDYLKKNGIKKLGKCDFDERAQSGTFEKHLQSVENSFWNDRFIEYTRWKERWWNKYLERGWIRYKTGFVVRGLYKKNEVLNYGIQGSAFHCLLWCEIQLIKFLIRRKFKSRIINQVYDSLLMDIHEKELDDILAMCKIIMEERIREHWKWIVAPLTVETEIGEENWYGLKEIKEKNGKWLW